MNALDSPLEVFLALDYLGFGLLTTVVNNAWTWVAVITAAVSVWRIRSTSSPRDHFPPQTSLINPPVSSPAAVTSSTAAAPPPRPSPQAFDGEGSTSGKFTLYYVREETEEGAANADEDGDMDGNGERKTEAVRSSWEPVMEMRMDNQMGFYRYQDVTVLDGNVVRLWDGCRRRSVINNAAAAAVVVRCGGHDYEYDWSS